LGSLLAAEGFEVLAFAGTEQQAIAWLLQNEGAWHVATLDLLLGEGSGFSVLQRCAASAQAGRVVVFSGFVTETVRARCLALGADAVFLKTQLAELRQYLRDVAQAPEAGVKQA